MNGTGLLLVIMVLGIVYYFVNQKMEEPSILIKETKQNLFKSGTVLKDTTIPNLRIVKEHETPIINGKRYIQESFKKVMCDEKDDLSCKVYNHRDIKSKCTTLCEAADKKMLFNGNHSVNETIHTCECIEEMPIVEGFSNIKTESVKLEAIETDSRFNDRNILEQHEQKRLQNLIFGQ